LRVSDPFDRKYIMRTRVLGQASLALVVLSTAPGVQEPPTWQIARDLRIDAIEHDLAPIGWLSVARDGTIIISQPQDTLLRFFNSSGTFLGTFGRGGSGPGEFRFIARRGWIGDTLWATDPLQRRSTFIGPDRKLVRSLRQHPSVRLKGESLDSTHTGLGVIPWAHLPGDRSIVAIFSSAAVKPIAWPGASPTGDPMLHVDATGSFLNVAGTFPHSTCDATYRLPGGGGSASVPFCGRPYIDMAPEGQRWANVVMEEQSIRRNAYVLTVTRPTGDTVLSRRYEGPAEVIPRRLGDSVVAALRSRARFQQEADALDQLKLPPVFPPFLKLLIGSDETYWIELYTRSGNRLWQILNGGGAPIGRVSIPRSVTIAVANRSTIWGIETDDDGIEHIVRYRLSR
jgi:hypothetical protein